MKILFIAPTLPQDFGSGGAMRSYQMYCQLEEFCRVDLITCNNLELPKNEVENFLNSGSYKGNYRGHIFINPTPPIFGKKLALSTRLQQKVDLQSYDYVIVRYYNSAYWLGLFNLGNL